MPKYFSTISNLPSLICILGILITGLSCSKGRQLLFEVNNEIEFIMPGGLNTIETHIFVIRDIPTLLEPNLELFGLTSMDPVTVNATRATISGSFQSIDYDFIGEIAVRARSARNPSLNREMFFMENIPFNHRGELQLFSSITDLTEIMKDKVFDMEVRIRLRSFVGRDIQHKLIFSYGVFLSE